MSLSGWFSRWRHDRAAGSDGQAAQPPNGIADHRRAMILAEQLRIGDGDLCRTRKPRDALRLPAGRMGRDESEVSDGDNLVSCAAPWASALRIVAPDTKTEHPAGRLEFTRWNVQK